MSHQKFLETVADKAFEKTSAVVVIARVPAGGDKHKTILAERGDALLGRTMVLELADVIRMSEARRIDPKDDGNEGVV